MHLVSQCAYMEAGKVTYPDNEDLSWGKGEAKVEAKEKQNKPLQVFFSKL